LPSDFARRNVAEESSDESSVLNTYRQLLRLRRATSALQRGDQELVTQRDADALSYVRRDGDAAAFVALSFASREVRVALPTPPSGRAWRVAFSTAGRSADALPESVTLMPLEALVATA
jgi:glycosidase